MLKEDGRRPRRGRQLLVAAVAVAMGIGTVAAASAAGRLEPVTAYLNKGLHIMVEGREWQPVDEAGAPLYPLTYEGRTYVPFRALEEDAFQFEVGWEAETGTITVEPGPDADLTFGHIVTRTADLTGDGESVTIRLYGHRPTDAGPIYNDSFVLRIEDGKPGPATMLFINDGGYGAATHLGDLTKNGADDLLISIPTGGSGGTYYSHLFTHRAGEYVELALPVADVTGSFADNYAVELTVPELGRTFTVDIHDKQAAYDADGLYKDGKRVKDTEPMIFPVAFYEIVQDDSGTAALNGYVEVSGLYHADSIADVTLTWQWGQNDWVLKSAKVVEAGVGVAE